ncbi:MAG: hypothetical protein GPJ54_08000 [Candidatus Heimdallarchaeota archaeon]|nr:hypothetical protein [Candidatus Heimdallarchaeota archaeon]
MSSISRGSIITTFILILLTSSLINLSTNAAPIAKLVYEPEQNYVITFINYDQGLLDTNLISSGLPSHGGNTLSYKINYEFQFANESYQNMINDYIDTISTTSWTSSLNDTALKEQKVDFGRKSIFERQNGTAIDAQLLEDFMSDNSASTTLKDENRFYLYVFNLSRFDDVNGDHWFNVSEIDPDSEVQRFYWRLEWDYDLGNNFDVRFPYAAYSNSSEISLIDPTAFQWYLEWRAIWNKNTDPHDSYYADLDHLIQGLDSIGQSNIVIDTITEWLNDWISKIYNMYFFPEELGKSMSVQMQVMYRGSESTAENLQWIVNSELVKISVNNLLQSSNIEVNVNFVDLEQDEFMRNLFLNAKVQYSDLQTGSSDPFSDWEFYNGDTLWTSIATDSSLNSQYFDDQAADIVVKGLLYLIDNASYVGPDDWIPWNGGLYTGLAGDRKMSMLWELDRAFMADHTTRKSGLSRVLIHEIGHAIGIPHTFDAQGDQSFDTFTSDFAFDVMGYYPGAANYSQILSKLYQREAADVEIQNLIQSYQIRFDGTSDTTLEYVSGIFDEAIQLHKERRYNEAYSLLINAYNALIQDTTNPSLQPTSTSSSTTQTSTTGSETDTVDSSSSKTSDSPVNTSIFVTTVLFIAVIYNKKFQLDKK